MNTVAIVGVGLIGGSFGLALRAAGFTGRITGVSSPKTTATGIARGAIDEALPLEEAARQADLVFLSTPILSILECLDRIDGYVKPGTLITDAGSTKKAIVDRARERVRKGQFLGGHPMAGKERSGIAEADPALFHGRPWALCPASPEELNTGNAAEFREWLGRIRARPVVLPAEEHDRVVAFTSHLPQLISTALAVSLENAPGAERLAGPAIHDLTRLASSPFSVWKDILSTNEAEIRSAVTTFVTVLRGLTPPADPSETSELFEKARETVGSLRTQSFRQIF